MGAACAPAGKYIKRQRGATSNELPESVIMPGNLSLASNLMGQLKRLLMLLARVHYKTLRCGLVKQYLAEMGRARLSNCFINLP